MVDFIKDGGVISTVLFLNQIWESASMRRLIDDHRFMTQHQLTITSPNSLTGSFSIHIIPDTMDAVILDAVDIGLTLNLENQYSGILIFSGIFRGIVLKKESGLDEKSNLTIVLSSTRGQS